MKKITAFFALIILISLTSCDTITRYTTVVSVDRHPTLIITNQTGHPVVVTAPISTSINNGARTQYQPSETNRNINVTYTINQIPFTEQVTWNNEDATVTLTKKPPSVTVINQTGHTVELTAPVRDSLANGTRTAWLANPSQRNISISYKIALFQYTEQAAMSADGATVTLTRSPPYLTIVNNTGYTIVTIQMRVAGGEHWMNQNILGLTLKQDGTVDTTRASMSTVDLIGSVENTGRRRIWLGMVELPPDRYDIRMDVGAGSGGHTFMKRNVQITNDMSLTFTQSDRP